MNNNYEICLIAEITMEAFEKRLLELQRTKEIINTYFDEYNSVFYARVMYRNKKYDISELPK